MRIVEPTIIILTELDGIQILKHIEIAGRICYKSEVKITEESCIKFVENLLKRGHETVLEHENISVRIVCDRGVSHEIVRHRLAAYCQECIVGDTKIKKKLTIKQLYDRQYNKTCYDKTHNKTIFLTSCNEKRNIIPNKFVNVFYKGIQPVYRVKTSLGYVIECTKNHKFLNNEDKYVTLDNLIVNDFVMVNGRPSLCYFSDKELIYAYNDKKLSPIEISTIYHIPYKSVLTKLKKLNIFVNHKNDKNKAKYFKNHTKESYKKMKKTIKLGYANGRVIWNKGITENDHPMVKKQAESLRKNHHNNGYKEKNSNWKNGPKSHKLAQLLKNSINTCELCGENKKLEVHHKDKNSNNNDLDNLIKVCTKCHHLLHHGWHVGTTAIKDKIISIEYSGMKDVYDLEMKNPYNNYIANGFVVHNSTRYCCYGNKDIEFIKPCFLDFDSKDVKEQTKVDYWCHAMKEAEIYYDHMLATGMTPQEARSVLPNSLKTEIVMTCNLREWRHFLKLRTSKAAHPQMIEIASMILKEFKNKIPVVFDDIVGN